MVEMVCWSVVALVLIGLGVYALDVLGLSQARCEGEVVAREKERSWMQYTQAAAFYSAYDRRLIIMCGDREGRIEVSKSTYKAFEIGARVLCTYTIGRISGKLRIDEIELL
jgi:hypothetical protein